MGEGSRETGGFPGPSSSCSLRALQPGDCLDWGTAPRARGKYLNGCKHFGKPGGHERQDSATLKPKPPLTAANETGRASSWPSAWVFFPVPSRCICARACVHLQGVWHICPSPVRLAAHTHRIRMEKKLQDDLEEGHGVDKHEPHFLSQLFDL